jgi:hypothetical protein
MGEWRKLHNGKLHSVYLSQNIIGQIKSRTFSWVHHVSCMGEDRKVYKVSMKKPKGKRSLRIPELWMGEWDQNGSYRD